MTPAKLNVYIAMFAYSGNGSIPSVSAITAKWLAHLMPKLIQDDKVGKVVLRDICDTPITMTRNWAVHEARKAGCDVLLMLDSDMHPDLYPNAPPFWDTAFEFLYDRLASKNYPTVIGAPYVGPPCDAYGMGEANPYVFRWYQRDEEKQNVQLRFVSRNEAALMKGIQPMGALPTGLILYTLNAFDLIKPPYFRYEMSDVFCHTKVSTEDCYNTREIGLEAAALGLGDVLFATMDSWAGHMKVKTMGKPFYVDSKHVSQTFHEHYVQNGEPTQGHEAWQYQGYDPEKEEGPESEAPQPFVDQHGNEWFPEEPPMEEVQGEDGKPVMRVKLMKRNICGYQVETVGNQTPQMDLLTLHSMILTQKKGRPLRVLEVGSWVGESAIAIASALEKLPNGGGTLFCVDHFGGSPNDLTGKVAEQVDPKEFFMRNTEIFRKSGHILLIEQESRAAANSAKKSQDLDVLYLDAGHTKEELLGDLRAWYRHVADDGIIMGHDLCDSFPGVADAITEFFPDTVKIMNPEGTLIWWVRKSEVLETGDVEEEELPAGSKHGGASPVASGVAAGQEG